MINKKHDRAGATAVSRPRAPRKSAEARAAEIAGAARDIALAQGLPAVTMRAVAAKVGVAPALVAHYEPQMDALVAAAFRAIVAAELDEIRAVLALAPSPTAGLATLAATLLDGNRDDVTAVWVEAWALGRRSAVLAAAVREEMDAWQQVIHDLIASGVAAGEFVTSDPQASAWQLLGMIDGLNAQALVRWRDDASRLPLLLRATEGMLGLPRDALTPSAG